MFLSISRCHCSFRTLPEISGWPNPVLVSFHLSVACHSAGHSSIKSLKNIKCHPGARCHVSYWEDKASRIAMVIAHVVFIIQWRIQRKQELQKTELGPSAPCLHWVQILSTFSALRVTPSSAGCSSVMSAVTVPRASFWGPLFALSAISFPSDFHHLPCACDVRSLDL